MRKQHEHCTVEGCGRKHKARGYCLTHYMQFKRGAEVTPIIAVRDRNPPEICIEPGCGYGPTVAKGLCKMHYARLLRHGHTRQTRQPRDQKPCSVTGCENWRYSHGLCHQHYMRKRRLMENYGLTPADEARMLAEQGGKCAVCRRESVKKHNLSSKITALCVDHDHRTNAVRGLLCDNCNRAIGLLQDSPDVLASAIVYLSRYAAEPRAVLSGAISTLQSALPLAA